MEGEVVYSWDDSTKTVTVEDKARVVNDNLLVEKNKATYEKFEDVIYKAGPGLDFKNGFVVGAHTKRSTFEIDPEKPKSLETPLQKLSRLQSETVDMLNFLQSLPKDTESAELNGEKPAAVIAEIEMLNAALEAVLLSPEIANSELPNVSGLTGKTSAKIAANAAKAAAGTVGAGSDSKVTFEIYGSTTAPASTTDTVSRTLTLENRLAALEAQVGHTAVSSLPFPDLSSGLEDLALRLASIDQARLESLSRKAKGMVGELEELTESLGRFTTSAANAGKAVSYEGSNSGPSGKETEAAQALQIDLSHAQKVDKLFSLVYQWRQAGSALPTVAARLKSLQAVHQNSANITARLQAVEVQQKNIAILMENAFSSLEETRGSITKSLEAMTRSAEVLEKRMEAIAKGRGAAPDLD